MKKIIKLTETDLHNIVRRVIEEQSNFSLTEKLKKYGFSGDSTKLSKKTKLGEFYFELKNGGAVLNVINPTNNVIKNFKLKKIGDKYTKGFQPELECERLAEYISKSIPNPIVKPVASIEEDRMDYERMSDDELHDLHPDIKKHEKHFKNFEPTSEYLRWKGEVSNRNIYKRGGKFHDSFDTEK